MTRLWVLSDLHLEAMGDPEAFRPTRPEYDVLVVAGDVWEGDITRGLRTVAMLAAGKPAVFVMGNSDYWNKELGAGLAVAKGLAGYLGITLLADAAVELAGARFMGATLWTDGCLSGAELTADSLTGDAIDVIQGGHVGRMTQGKARTLHREARQALDRMLAGSRRDQPVVVVTHHAPHPLCLPAEMRGTEEASVFASNLSTLIEEHRPDLWVHGHIHRCIDFTHGATRIVCNAAGPGLANPEFRENWVVEV